eukprot:8210561-Prorocentrum_lima.AAC.1
MATCTTAENRGNASTVHGRSIPLHAQLTGDIDDHYNNMWQHNQRTAKSIAHNKNNTKKTLDPHRTD